MPFRKILFILIFTILSSADAQKSTDDLLLKPINYSCSQKTIGTVLKEIGEKYKIKFTYINNQIPTGDSVSITATNCSLKFFLEEIIKDPQIEFFQINSQILIKKTELIAKPDSSNAKVDSVSIIKETTTTNKYPNSNTIKADNLESNKGNNGELTIYYFSGRNKGIGYFYKRQKNRSRVYVDTLYSVTDTSRKGKIYYKIKYKKLNSKAFMGFGFKTRWDSYLSLAAGVGYSDYKLSALVSLEATEKLKIEKPNNAYWLDLGFTKYLTRNIVFNIGINYITFGESGKYKSELILTYSAPLGGGGGGNPQPAPQPVLIHDTTILYTNKYQIATIPLGLGYSMGNKLGFKVNLSLNPGYFMNSETNYSQQNYSEFQKPINGFRNTPPQGFRNPMNGDTAYYYKKYLDANARTYDKFQLGASVSFELFWMIQKRIRIFVSPKFTYQVKSIYSKNDSQNQKPYVYGICAGFSYCLYHINY